MNRRWFDSTRTVYLLNTKIKKGVEHTVLLLFVLRLCTGGVSWRCKQMEKEKKKTFLANMFKVRMLFKPLSSVRIHGCFIYLFIYLFVTSQYHTVFLYPSLPQFIVPYSHYHSFVCLSSPAEKREIPRGLFLSLPAALCSALKLGDATVFFIQPPRNTHTHTHEYSNILTLYPWQYCLHHHNTTRELFNSVAQGWSEHVHLDVMKG